MQIRQLLKDHIRTGSLRVEFADGRCWDIGEGEPAAVWRLDSPRVLRRVAADPGFMLGQSYMDGAWQAPGGLLPLLRVLMLNFRLRPAASRWRWLLLPLQQWNRARSSRRNVSAHYDLDEAMFRQFLDADMHYSCAYFADPRYTLEQAQQAKCEHILRKLQPKPGQRILDIGCGWGGLAMYLAERAKVRVTGLTLSREQYRVAQERIRERKLQDRVEVRLEDYRQHRGDYDRVVSVGMFEHVGAPFFERYFREVHERLPESGIALIHTIGRCGPPGVTTPWVRRYIFPGGYIPAMSEALAAVEQVGLICADVEVLRKHYARTLEAWLERFQLVRADWVARRGETFCRMWEFYLAASAASFRWRDLVVFQFQLCRSLDALPLTRDYLYAESGAAGAAPMSVVGGRSA